MYKRKEFIKISAGAAIGFAFGSNKEAAFDANTTSGTIKNLGIQLYTLRDDMPHDPKGVFKKLAKFGYKEIESYEGPKGMFWDMKHQEFKKYMDDLGMTIVSSHVDFRNDLERKAAEAGEIGMKYLVCPYIGAQKSLDDYKKFAELFNHAGEICKKNGLRFAYHNHDYAYRMHDDVFPIDVLIDNTDESLVDFEMDMYWVVAAAQDPIYWLNKHSKRYKLCHIKDRQKGITPQQGEKNLSCIVGKGSIPYKDILAIAKNHGMTHYILEQEAYEKAPIECVKEGADYLKRLKF